MSRTRNVILESARKKIFFTRHALDQMNKPERFISPAEVQSVIFEGEIIEDYPEDSRGPSCLMAGFGIAKRLVHVVCSPKDDYLAVITAYLPNEEGWLPPDFKKRR